MSEARSYYTLVTDMIDSGLTGWGELWADAQKLIPQVEADPRKFEIQAAGFVQNMRETRKALDALKPLVGKDPIRAASFNRLNASYEGLKERFMTDARQVGFLMLMTIAGVAMGAAAIAWAYSQIVYSEGLRLEAQAQLEDTRNRDAASREGRTLQPSSIPAPGSGRKKEEGSWTAYALPAAAVLAGGVGAWFYFGKGKP